MRKSKSKGPDRPPIPDYELRNPDPGYIRQLIERTGMSHALIARQTGMSLRTLQRYIDDDGGYGIPYARQFMLESLANYMEWIRS